MRVRGLDRSADRSSTWLGVRVALCALATSWVSCAAPLIFGDRVLCGEPPDVGFYYATFQRPREKDSETKPIWSGTRRVKLGEPVGVGGADVTDLRVVSLGSGTTMSVGGSIDGQGGTVPVGERTPTGSAGPWAVDVRLTPAGARRLSQVVEEIAGSYQVLALVVGDEVFSASIELPVSLGTTRIEFPESRSKEGGIAFFREKMGCPAALGE